MASISTCFSTATPKYKFTSHSTAFCAKPSFRLHSIKLQTSLHFNNSLKLRRSNRRSVVLIRASVDVASEIRPGAVVESDKLPSDVRKRAMKAIDSFGGRVTIGDVASKAGLKLNEAQKALQALAADTDGFLEVFILLLLLNFFPGYGSFSLAMMVVMMVPNRYQMKVMYYMSFQRIIVQSLQLNPSG